MRLMTLIAVSLCCSSVFGQAEFTLLGRLPGGANYASAAGISADGQVVVGSSGSSLAFWGESYRWTPENGIEGLGSIDGVPGSDAYGVSPDGNWIVGYAGLNGVPDSYIWNERTGGILLGDLGGADFDSRAFDVSRNGRVVIGSASSPQGLQAYRWTPNGGMVGLGFFDENNPHSGAYAVNADGSKIVGFSGTSATSGEAFLWTEQNGMVGLGDIEGGFDISLAYSISNNGKWIAGEGNAEYADGRRSFEAVLWDESGEMTRLGQLGDDGSRYSRAWDVSNDGRVAVGVASWSGDIGEGRGQAMIWTPEWGMRRLENVLLDEYGLDVQEMGWRLDSALGISADGKYIVGNAFTWINDDIHVEGYRLYLPSIPTPATLAPLAGLGLLGMRRRREQ